MKRKIKMVEQTEHSECGLACELRRNKYITK